MKYVFSIFILVAAALSLVTPFACKFPAPDQFFEYVADCGVDECRAHCPEIAGPVTACLLSGDISGCLSGLIVPAYGITKDVVACVVRKIGMDFNAKSLAAEASPDETRAAAAARAWILENKIGYR